MAYFEIDFTPDGVNNAALVDSDQWMVAGETHIDILLWNKSDAPVDIVLASDTESMLFSIGQDEYTVEHERINQRDVIINNGLPIGENFFEITHLAPRSVYPLRITNVGPASSNTHWLDAASCRLEVRGHTTNLYNGERVYVIGHSPSHA